MDTQLGPVMVELVLMLEERWHLEDLQGKVSMIKISFSKEAEVRKV